MMLRNVSPLAPTKCTWGGRRRPRCRQNTRARGQLSPCGSPSGVFQEASGHLVKENVLWKPGVSLTEESRAGREGCCVPVTLYQAFSQENTSSEHNRPDVFSVTIYFI